MKDDREEELFFRGNQIASAVERYQRKNGNALPPSIDTLVKGRFLRKAYRDQVRADAVQRCSDAEAQLAEVKQVLRVRILSDDARDEIHLQDLAEKKQMSACIARLKGRLTENHIAFDDLL